VRDCPAARKLLLGGLHVLEDVEALEERVVLPHAHEDGGATAVLRENDRPAGALDASNNGGELGTESREGLDIGRKARHGHRNSQEYVLNIVHI
jgi:hypothetical protein